MNNTNSSVNVSFSPSLVNATNTTDVPVTQLGMDMALGLMHCNYFQLCGIVGVYLSTFFRDLRRKNSALSHKPRFVSFVIASIVSCVCLIPWVIAIFNPTSFGAFVGYTVLSVSLSLLLQAHFIQQFYIRHIEKREPSRMMIAGVGLAICVVVSQAISLIIQSSNHQFNFFAYLIIILWFIGVTVLIEWLVHPFYDQFGPNNPLPESPVYQADRTILNPRRVSFSGGLVVAVTFAIFIVDFLLPYSTPKRSGDLNFVTVIMLTPLIAATSLLLYTTLEMIYLSPKASQSEEEVAIIDQSSQELRDSELNA